MFSRWCICLHFF